jgi:glutathione S-transferase
MTLQFYGHPLSSYCWKALTALYEVGADFEFRMLADLSDAAERERFLALSPLGKMPALLDGGRVLSESSIVIEHVAPQLIPDDVALDVRYWDRMFDLYCHSPMQRLVGYKLRAEGNPDRFGVRQAKAELASFYGVVERHLNGRTWAVGERFTLADCAAGPALHYGNKIVPIGEAHPRLRAYLDRLEGRPSFARVLKEAEPYAHLFPGAPED